MPHSASARMMFMGKMDESKRHEMAKGDKKKDKKEKKPKKK